MRITRSTLRRLIAEESARLLREAAFPAEVEGDDGDVVPKMLHIMYRGFRPVFIVTDVDANPHDEKSAEDVTEVIAPAKSNMSTADYAKAIIDFITDESNDIMYVFDEEMNDSESDDKFTTEEYVNHLMSMMASGGADEVTDGIEQYQRAGMSGEDEDLYEGEEDDEEDIDLDTFSMGEPVSRRALVKRVEPNEFDLEFAEEFGADDDSWMDDEGSDDDIPFGAADVAGRMGRGHRTDEADEADAAPSPLEAAEHRLRAAIKAIRPDKVTSLTKRVLDIIDDVMMEEAIAAEADGSTAFPFNASVKVLEQMGDTFPEDADFEPLHAAIDAVIKPQWEGALESAAEAEADRRDVEDTERDLTHPSRFLEEGGGDSPRAPRARLKAYLKSKHANIAAVMKAIDAVLAQHHEADPDEDLGDPTSEDVTFRLPDAVLRYIPQKDSDLWHSMIDDVLNDEFDPTAAGEAAAYRKDIEDTERDLSHPSRFLEGRDPLDSSDYEGSRHHRAYSDDPDDESGSVDRWGEPIPYLKHDSEATDLDAAAEDEMAGEEEDWSWDGHDYEPDLKRTSRYAHTAQKYKETGNSDPGMDPDDHIFGMPRGLDETDDSQSDDEEVYDRVASDWAASEVRRGRHADGPYGGLDSDTPEWHRQQKRKAAFPPRAFSDDKSARGMYFRDGGDDISMGYTDEEGGGDNLSESRWAKLAGILKG